MAIPPQTPPPLPPKEQREAWRVVMELGKSASVFIEAEHARESIELRRAVARQGELGRRVEFSAADVTGCLYMRMTSGSHRTIEEATAFTFLPHRKGESLDDYHAAEWNNCVASLRVKMRLIEAGAKRMDLLCGGASDG